MPVAALSVPEDTGSRPVNRDLLADLRQQVARLERGGRVTEGAVGFGLPEIDDVLPGGGLLKDAVHECLGSGAAVWAICSQPASKGRSCGVSTIRDARTLMGRGLRLWVWTRRG